MGDSQTAPSNAANAELKPETASPEDFSALILN